MKVVINRCYGGFGLSPAAVRRLAELKGKPCYFFKVDYPTQNWEPISEEEASKGLFWMAMSTPNPNEDIGPSYRDADGLYKSYNEKYAKFDLPTGRKLERHDPLLIQVVEELGPDKHREGASGRCAQLHIVEIPDGVQYEIDEYDGMESIHEIHRSWL